MSSRRLLRTACVMTVVGIALGACTTNKINTGTFRLTEEDKGLVLLESTAYQGVTPTRVTYDDYRLIEEYTLYRGAKGQAEILFAQPTRHYAHSTVLTFDKLISTSARMWRFNQGQTLKFEEAFTVDNAITTFWVQPYKQVEAGRDCAGFSARWETRPDDRQLRPGRIMFGYHCAPKGMPFSADDAMTLVKEIQIRGVSVPLRVETVYELQKGAPPAPPKDVQVRHLVLAQDGGGGGISGLPDFPLLIADTYNDLDGPCKNC